MDSAYVPNNPQFGLQLECNWTASPCGAEAGADLWSEDMASFALPLDLDPLPSLFPFSPGQPQPPQGYKTEPSFSTIPQKQPQGADVADVLLSLKHAVVHPSGSPAIQEPLCHLLSSPSGYPDQPFTQQCFPSMSVNVSMNMTMHAGYPPPPTSVGGYGGCGADITCPQMQWNATPQGSSPVSYQTQGLLSPSYGGTTYSFTADFRPPQDSSMLGSYKPVPMSFSPPRKRYSVNLIEDDSQKPNVCRICGKSYARPSTLKTHLRTHSGEKPYRCIDCNKSFSQAANLTAHVRTHSGEKPFRCPVCDRRFSQSSSVTTHMRTHSGERPYRCRLCRKAFSDSSTLTKHLRIHSGEKPYECKLCLLRFSQSGNLNRHMRVHAGQVGGYQPP